MNVLSIAVFYNSVVSVALDEIIFHRVEYQGSQRREYTSVVSVVNDEIIFNVVLEIVVANYHHI